MSTKGTTFLNSRYGFANIVIGILMSIVIMNFIHNTYQIHRDNQVKIVLNFYDNLCDMMRDIVFYHFIIIKQKITSCML